MLQAGETKVIDCWDFLMGMGEYGEDYYYDGLLGSGIILPVEDCIRCDYCLPVNKQAWYGIQHIDDWCSNN